MNAVTPKFSAGIRPRGRIWFDKARKNPIVQGLVLISLIVSQIYTPVGDLVRALFGDECAKHVPTAWETIASNEGRTGDFGRKDALETLLECEESLERLILTNASLSGVKLGHAILSGTQLDSAQLDGADLSRTRMFRVNMSHADVSRANLHHAQMFNSDLTGAHLVQSLLFQSDLRFSRLDSALLLNAKLKESVLHGVSLVDADLGFAHLGGADLSTANVRGASFAVADLRNANLSGLSNWREIRSLLGANVFGVQPSQAPDGFLEWATDTMGAVRIEGDLRWSLRRADAIGQTGLNFSRGQYPPVRRWVILSCEGWIGSHVEDAFRAGEPPVGLDECVTGGEPVVPDWLEIW